MNITNVLNRIASEILKTAKVTEWTKLLDKAQHQYLSKLSPVIEHFIDTQYQRETNTHNLLVDNHLYVTVLPNNSISIEGNWEHNASVNLLIFFQNQNLAVTGSVNGRPLRKTFDPSNMSSTRIAKEIAEHII